MALRGAFILILLGVLGWATAYTPTTIYSPPLSEVPIYKSIQESVYYVELSVGTPPQVQRLIIDTEIEFSLLIANTSCPSSAYGLHCFDLNASSTFTSGENLEHFCLLMADQAGFIGVPYRTTGRFCLSQYNPSLLGRLTDVDGYFGMGYVSYDNYAFEMWPSLLPREWPLVHAIQFGGKERDSALHFGGYYHAEEISWSEQQTNLRTADPVFIEAPLFHFSLCGTELSPEDSFVMAQFVSSHNCLGLSRTLLLSVRKWLEDFCWQDEDNDLQTGHMVCRFQLLEQIQQLPTLTFTLGGEGRVLHLPLASLVTSRIRVDSENSSVYDATLCIIQSDHFPSHSKDKIVFGILPMEQFYTVIDVEEGRVGLWDYMVNSTDGQSHSPLCPSPPTCIGQQELSTSTNECIDPTCRLWEQIDDETKTCGVSKPLLVVVLVNLIILSAIDYCMTETHLRLERRVKRTTSNVHNE